MFARANEIGGKFTFPVVQAWVRHDGKVGVSLGAAVLINSDGWALTAWHVVQGMLELGGQVAASRQHAADEAAIEASAISDKERREAKRALKRPPRESALGMVNIWAAGGTLSKAVAPTEYRAIPEVDLAVVKLTGLPSSLPVAQLKDPSKPMPTGRSLCKLGFPFHNMGVSYDAAAKRFNFAKDAFPVPLFPLEGIMTRTVDVPGSGGQIYRLIETSSAGLKGQSGGPIMDVDGCVWAIQSATALLDTGFDPPDEKGRKIRQFHPVGMGPHAETISAFLRAQGIAFSLSSN
jgi:S1-C subfamily serine protease